jgi:hypothetical protein
MNAIKIPFWYSSGKDNFRDDLSCKHILFMALSLSQGLLYRKWAASGHWLFRYSLILKKASGWGHYRLITVCDYWHILQWPHSVYWPVCSQENLCSWKFWLTKKFKWGFFFGMNWRLFLLKCQHIFLPSGYG